MQLPRKMANKMEKEKKNSEKEETPQSEKDLII